MVLLRIINRGLSTIVSIILARILAPEAYGIIAVAMLAISLIQIFSEVGIKQSLIKENDYSAANMLDTAWTIEMLRGILIYCVVYLIAGRFALFFSKPETIPVIQVLGLLPLLRGLTSIRIIYLQKELRFKEQFLYEISGIAGPLLVSIPLALLLQNVWAIVWGTLASEIIKVGFSFVLAPYLPKFRLNFTHFARMFKFGKWILYGSIFSYFAMEIDTFFAAKFFDPRNLGLYSLAFAISNKPVAEIAKAMSNVLFPAFAKISGNRTRLIDAFLKSSFVLYLFIIPLALVIHLSASDFVLVFLGDEWIDIIACLEILTIGVIFRVLTIPSGGLFNGIGKPKLVFLLGLLRMLLLITGLAILNTRLTLTSLSYVVLYSNLGVFVGYLVFLFKELGIRPFVFIGNIYVIIISGIVLFSGITFLNFVMSPGLLRLLIKVFSGATIFIAVMYAFSRLQHYKYINSYISQILKK